MLGKLDNDQIDNLLRSQVIGRLACSAGHNIHIVPVTYAFQKNSIFIHTLEGLKVNIMRQNPHVAFEVDQIIDMRNWQTVVVKGKYEELKDKQGQDALDILMNRLIPISTSEAVPPKYGMEQLHLEKRPLTKPVIFKILITEKSGRFERS